MRASTDLGSHMNQHSSDSGILEADYLVVGSGAMGMAFIDTIVAESDKTVIVVDRRDRPGGHWSNAYPFVRLHLASAYYGVNSRALGAGTIDRLGLNRGYHEQASAAEICGYFDRIMQTQFLPSGRVRYFPRCEYRSDGTFVSMVTGEEHRVLAKRTVDATFTDTAVPSEHAPPYAIDPDVRCISPNALPDAASASQYVVVGAGKTGMDVCLWLLARGVPERRISWIMPRDSWLLDRTYYEPGDVFWLRRMNALVMQTEAVQQADSLSDVLLRLNECGQLLRIDPRVVPGRYRCATVSSAELDELRRIEHVVRLGHVRQLQAGRVVLEKGTTSTHSKALYIDCSASGIRSRPTVPVFDERRITLQPIRTCQQCFSSALIAHIELTHDDDAHKNALARPIALPIRSTEWLPMFVANLANQSAWASHAGVREWTSKSRLDVGRRTSPLSSEEHAVLQKFKASVSPALANAAMLMRGSSLHPSGTQDPAGALQSAQC
jgi:hypothetical protein